MMMDIHLFDYTLPKDRIAQTPLPKGKSRMMVASRQTGEVKHETIANISRYLRSGDRLVFNDTKVMPARLLGTLPTGGKVEIFLFKDMGGDRWQCLARPARKLKKGQKVQFHPEGEGTIQAVLPSGKRVIQLSLPGKRLMEKVGHIPLPPYIRREDRPQDAYDYQTIYAREEGSVAAPTAGLHFTQEILDHLASQGVHLLFLTLHVSLGTFKPIKTQNLEDHQMDEEVFYIPDRTAEDLIKARKEGERIIGVGTTVVRALESAWQEDKQDFQRGWQTTRLFIKPPYTFRTIDGLLTNFHLPRSSLFVLVSTFAGREKVLQWYQEAIQERYRFYSYGDCMLIL